MVNKKDCKVVVLKRSCLTGRIVWAYRGDSEEGARKAYWRACKKEVRRVRNWMKRMANRRRQLLRIITHSDSSSVSSSMLKSMNPQQRAAARKIMQLAKREPPLDRAFYDHIVEEAKRRNWQSGRWKKAREKMIRYGQTHTVSEYQPKDKKKKQ